MITHEEMRNYVAVKLIKEKVNLDEVIKYINQQEKVTELLGLYQTYHYEPSDINQRIKTLEKELGEMK